MSDSDDTDTLLLIPPNFFSINTSYDEDFANYTLRDSFYSLPTAMDKVPKDYSYLPLNQQMELKNIDAKLLQLDKNFSASTDLSTISNYTVRSKYPVGSYSKTRERPSNEFAHSTPKYTEDQRNKHGQLAGENNGVMKEIDRFLENNQSPWKYEIAGNSSLPRDGSQPLSLPNPEVNELHLEKMSRLSDWSVNKPRDNDPLISLSEIWGGDGLNGNLSLQEERLRRQHCEKTIHALQSKLLKYKQKISVAIQVDKVKDAALMKHQTENSNLKTEIQKYQELVGSFENYQKEIKRKNENLEKELAQAFSLATKFQEKNENLENKLENFSSTANDYKKQIEDLELKISTTNRTEEMANEELAKMKDKLVREQFEAEKVLKQHDQLKSEMECLKQQNQTILEQFRTEKKRNDHLEKQNKSLTESLADLNHKEKNFQKELESQRQSLKAHYQLQLEKVVTTKLQEFQAEIDKVEETLRNEGKDRERLIAERSLKQIEMINEKNEQELQLLHEKQSEEVELYRIQLANASKKIEELEAKLSLYKSKRADIAEKLHGVMETQWQKALEILTSPNQSQSVQSIKAQCLDKEKLDGTSRSTKPENESFETPTSSRNRKSIEKDKERKPDRLQEYIEMLLSKSPRDLERLDEVLTLSKTQQTSSSKTEKPTRQTQQKTTPWK